MRIFFSNLYEKEHIKVMLQPLPKDTDSSYLQYCIGWGEMKFVSGNGELLMSLTYPVIDAVANLCVGYSSIEHKRATQGDLVAMEPHGARPLWYEKRNDEYIFFFRNGSSASIGSSDLRVMLLRLYKSTFSSLVLDYPGIEELSSFQQWKSIIESDLGEEGLL